MSDSTETTLEKIQKYFSILEKVLNPEEYAALETADLERLAVCPRGLTDDEGGTAGGLLEFSLDVALKAKSMSSHYDVDPRSIVKVALLHELGRMGSLTDESQQLYLNQDSDWHREKLGQNYKYNPACTRMNIGHRTLWMLNDLGIKLSREEFVAVMTSQGFHLQENAFYATTATSLTCLLQAARQAVLTA